MASRRVIPVCGRRSGNPWRLSILYRQAHQLSEELVFTQAAEERVELVATLTEIPVLFIDHFGMRNCPTSAAEDLREMSRVGTGEPPPP